MSCRMTNHRRPKAYVWLAGAIAFSSFLMPSVSQAQDLNQQLTVRLNSGTHSPARNEADRLLQLGSTQSANGDLPSAIASWQRAQLLYQQIGDMDGQGLAYNYLVLAYNQTGQTRAREDAMRRQLAVARDQRDFTGQIYASNNLGRALAPRLEGGSTAAGEMFVEGMTVASGIRNRQGEYLTARNMTWLANSLDQPDLLTRRYEVAFLPPNQWTANPVSYGVKLNAQGERRLNEQRYYMATRFNTVADTLGERANSPSIQFRAIDDLVVAYRAMGRYDLATDSLDDRLQLARSLNSPREELATLALLGEINQDVGRTELAQRYYEQALVVAQQVNDPRLTTIFRERLAGFRQDETPKPIKLP